MAYNWYDTTKRLKNLPKTIKESALHSNMYAYESKVIAFQKEIVETHGKSIVK